MNIDSHFPQRHIGPDKRDLSVMLDALKLESLDSLIDLAVPSNIRQASEPLVLPEALSESEALSKLKETASKNQVLTSLIGLGYYNNFTPTVIQRNILENPAWYTAYTPYQPEISQGRLEALINYQTLVSELTGCELSNASLLDEPTAVAESMALLHRVQKSTRNTFLLDQDSLPQTKSVVMTRAEAMGIDVVVGDPDHPPEDCFAVLYQYPGASGEIRNLSTSIKNHQEKNILIVVAADLLALTLLTPPGELGADVVVGSSQRFGVPMGFGGPHAGYIAVKADYKRSLPGRLVGASIDAHGDKAFRLALQTREQHIRREKATSNICTAQVLLAIIAGMYGVYHGPEGLTKIAQRTHSLMNDFVASVSKAGYKVMTKNWFDTVTIQTLGKARLYVEKALNSGFNLRLIDSDHIGVSFDETTDRKVVSSVLSVFTDDEALENVGTTLPEDILRKSDFCQQPVFSLYRSETEMLRYIRKLSDKDLALDRTMIPLGSCTMKLNASSEMIPISWSEFANLHPFVPAAQRRGYDQLISELEDWLIKITGYFAVSLQPNAGSQGEFAGLLAIRAYHLANGHSDRNICLIPASAHGTNAASAVMAGMKVVVVECDDNGNVDLVDLANKAEENSQTLSAIMITYPSTHGVYEEAVSDICEIIHSHGGQVYLDGANLNALVGIAQPGKFGADVSHLNLHKTFCIPHGGGGPGVGPVAVAQHLADFLPSHPLAPELSNNNLVGSVSGAPWGSASILPISWAYIAMMGSDGLTHATRTAILNANYIAKRLSDHYDILFTGKNGFIAHECIIDIRPINANCGVSADDIAKRLMDYGFHAPTMSFPVPGTLMIEPTESESLREIDKFCDAMISIKNEINQISSGIYPYENSLLHNAPHTAEHATASEWNHPYTREEAVYPVKGIKEYKYWPPVGRIDGAYGDKNLVCSCPNIDEFRE
ncbi:MAG: glycine dehydrogenase (aminomethyl-transferring) [Acidimicrobiaceae bacterium]|nr:glycine dehydrogenase (aminomethyl-transferring) [Acidimicrobiaceae bacterium]|tara:strand:+ start:22759 stop:25590 length:2832 start_codon:yes stop_codon:yes gene_type:complete